MTMQANSESVQGAVLSHVHATIAQRRFTRLIAFIYDRISSNSEKSYLTRSQAETVLSLFHLPRKAMPQIVSFADMCVLIKNGYDERYGRSTGKGSTAETMANDGRSDDEANVEHLGVLCALNSLRSGRPDCSNIMKHIREENLIRTVLRQAQTLRELKGRTLEMERKLDFLIADYVAERCGPLVLSEISEYDSGCNTERSTSPNSASQKSTANAGGTKPEIQSSRESVCASPPGASTLPATCLSSHDRTPWTRAPSEPCDAAKQYSVSITSTNSSTTWTASQFIGKRATASVSRLSETSSTPHVSEDVVETGTALDGQICSRKKEHSERGDEEDTATEACDVQTVRPSGVSDWCLGGASFLQCDISLDVFVQVEERYAHAKCSVRRNPVAFCRAVFPLSLDARCFSPGKRAQLNTLRLNPAIFSDCSSEACCKRLKRKRVIEYNIPLLRSDK